MGKKKSVVLMVLLTIVIVALCALVAFPAFPIPGTPNKWNPVALQYDLGADLGGGYYAYCYPEGVISETEYSADESALKEAIEVAANKDKAQAEYDEYVDSYAQYKGLYLSTDEELGIWDGNAPTAEFKANFAKAADMVIDRYNQKGYSDYRVAIVDDFSLRVELPKSEVNVNSILTAMSLTGEMTVTKGGETVDELKTEGATASDLIKSVSVATRYKTAYLKIKFTAKGEEMIERVKGELSESSAAQNSSDASSVTTLDIKIGDETIAQIYKDSIMDNNREARVLAVDQVNKAYLKTFEIVLDSALETGDSGVTFRSITTGDIRTFEPVYGDNVLTLLYIALAIVIVALIVAPIVAMGRYGAVGAYGTLSYFVITTLCFAFITGGTFEITLGSVLVFLAGLVLINVLHAQVYRAIKKEFDLGKTVESSIKGGFKKTLWGIVDIYAVLLLASLSLLLATGGLYTMALQAIICVVTGAFCNLLWLRALNYTLLSASKNKFKYFRFVREDDDDE